MKRLGRYLLSSAAATALLTSCGGNETQSGAIPSALMAAPDHKTKPKCGTNNGVKVTPCPIKLVDNASRDVTISGPNVTYSRYAEGDCGFTYSCNIQQLSALEWKVTGYKCSKKLKKKIYFLGAISIYGMTASGLIQGYGTLGIKFGIKKCKK